MQGKDPKKRKMLQNIFQDAIEANLCEDLLSEK